MQQDAFLITSLLCECVMFYHPDIFLNRSGVSQSSFHLFPNRPLEDIIAKNIVEITTTFGIHTLIMEWKRKLIALLTGMKMSSGSLAGRQ